MHIKEFSKFTTGRVKVTPSESLKFSFGKARLGGGVGVGVGGRREGSDHGQNYSTSTSAPSPSPWCQNREVMSWSIFTLWGWA